MPTKLLRVFGRVQGVGFRASTFYAAVNHRITGWVRNRRDGSVEIMANGTAADVDAFIAWAHKGPSMAQVENVEVSEGAGEFADFRISDTL